MARRPSQTVCLSVDHLWGQESQDIQYSVPQHFLSIERSILCFLGIYQIFFRPEVLLIVGDSLVQGGNWVGRVVCYVRLNTNQIRVMRTCMDD